MKGSHVSSSGLVEFRSIEEAQLVEIHRLQNGDARMDILEFFELEIPWIPQTLGQLRTKVEELQKEQNKWIFGIWSGDNEFVGLVSYDTSWDTWTPFFSVLIWPHHRRKGYGSAAACLILRKTFGQSVAHSVGSFIQDWNKAGIAFCESLGFKRAGVKRRAGVFDGRFYDGIFFDILRDEHVHASPKEAER